MVGTVFKVIALSVIIMGLSDTLFVALDSLTVTRRVAAVQNVMMREMQRNNGVPAETEALFNTQLQSIITRSNIAKSVDTNMEHSLTVRLNGADVTVPKVGIAHFSSGEQYNYGELMYSAIKVEMQPRSILFSSTANARGEFTAFNYFRYYQDYVETVPALRYLK